MKLHAIKSGGKNRELKDLLDIAELIKKNNVNVTADDFKELCLKYGTEDIYKKLVAFLA